MNKYQNKLVCTKCNKTLFIRKPEILTSFPPQIQYECVNCGNIELLSGKPHDIEVPQEVIIDES